MSRMSLRNLGQWLRPRSAGVPVSRPVGRAIRRGDAARSQGRWTEAATHYARAISIAPELAHIWVQLGHASREAGDESKAEQSYATAVRLAPDDAEAHRHLGYLAARRGDVSEAATHQFDALRCEPGNLTTATEFLRLVSVDDALHRPVLGIVASLAGFEYPDDCATDQVPEGTLLVDVSDLFEHFGRSRLPTGIQRVQIEIATAIASGMPGRALLVVYSPGQRCWKHVPPATFRHLTALSLERGDPGEPAWRDAVLRAHAALAVAPQLKPSSESALLDLGSSWRPGYFEALEACASAYVPLLYDLLPIVAPHWFAPAHAREYARWFQPMVAHARAILCISAATRDGLLRVAAQRGHAVDPAHVGIVMLDGDIRARDRDEPDPATAAAMLDFEKEPYVLFVSTIEPRKNHLHAFETWRRLIAQGVAMPVLVCVGGAGWMNDDVHALLRRDARLRERVRIVHGLPDAGLERLYRGCLFTLYPSFAEGWGLPVTESLCHGKIPATSNAAAVLEAGSGLAATFDPRDIGDMMSVLSRLVTDTELRHTMEARIAERYHPRSWHAIADDMIGSALRLTGITSASASA